MLLLENVSVSKAPKKASIVQVFVPKVCRKLKISSSTWESALKQNIRWLQYVEDLSRNVLNGAFDEISLCETDRHGARVSVVESTSPSFVFLSGIILVERKNVVYNSPRRQ